MKSFLEDLARGAGALAMDYRKRLSQLRVDAKGARDMVTEADIAVEEFIIRQIRSQYPDHAILGEESGHHTGSDTRWIIDPIDGTLSFMRGQPDFSVSIGIEQAGRIIAGAVYIPVLDELFVAEQGKGAMLNNEPIQVSETATVRESLMGTGFACIRNECGSMNLFYLPRLIPFMFEIRRYGSAAMHMAYVACGRLDGFYEFGLGLHDMAAGKILVKEAGGRVTDFAGGETDLPGQVAATNTRIHDEFLSLLSSLSSEYKSH